MKIELMELNVNISNISEMFLLVNIKPLHILPVMLKWIYIVKIKYLIIKKDLILEYSLEP